MTEHSPGPWMFHGPRSNIHICEAARPHMRICFLTSDGPTRENAALIAAAPAMLAELERLFDLYGHQATADVISQATLPTGFQKDEK